MKTDIFLRKEKRTKAIMVFELPSDWEVDDLYLLRLWIGNAKRKEEVAYKKIPIKLLPQRKESLVIADGDGIRFEGSTEFEQGYNSCLDEILGGNE